MVCLEKQSKADVKIYTERSKAKEIGKEVKEETNE
jgi:hypothetical protein